MIRFCACGVRSLRAIRLSAAVLAVAFHLETAGLMAAESRTIVRVEEDWELVVSNPDTTNNSPQVTCAMSPNSHNDGQYMSFELNHQSHPDYATGGLHLHAWNGAYAVSSVHAQGATSLARNHETISWTQRMSVEAGILTYAVLQGTSETWGQFGTGELVLGVPTDLVDLNAYSPDTTLAGSGVGFGANRVSSFVLKRVRLYTADGLEFVIELNLDALAPAVEE